MITAASLKSQKSKDLAQLAKKKGVEGWHSMRKEQLVKALLKLAKQKERAKNKPTKKPPAKPSISSRTKNGVSRKVKAKKPESDSAIAKKIRLDREHKDNLKNLSFATSMSRRNTAPESDLSLIHI